MVVYQNSLITITYTPETDILLVDWPNVAPYAALEVKESLQKLIEIMKNYDVKNLLLDASKAEITMSDAEYKTITDALAAELKQTRVQKLARILTSDPVREEKVYTMRLETVIPYQFQDFKTKAEALTWLTR